MDNIKSNFPLHYFVWQNNSSSLEDALLLKKLNIEQLDTRKRTPLMLAINLCKVECVRILLRYGANPTKISAFQWTPLQEAISTGNKELVKLVQTSKYSWIIKEAASKIKRVLDSKPDDLYFEIDWEYSSWLPFLNSINLNDKCRIWRKGSKLRVDFNQIGFSDNIPMVKRKLSYIFSSDKNFITIDEVDVTLNTCYRHHIDVEKLESADEDFCGFGFQNTDEEEINDLINQPVFTSFLNAEQLEYSKTKAGFFSKQETSKVLDKLEAQLFNCNDIRMTFMRRADHLSDDWVDEYVKSKAIDNTRPNSNNKQAAMLNIEESKQLLANSDRADFNPNKIKAEDYFDNSNTLPYDIGRTKRMITKTRNFNSTKWTTNDMPDKLMDQVKSYLDIAAYFNPFIYRLNSTLKKSSFDGFPLEINMPLYYAIYGKIHFTNFYGSIAKSDHVKSTSQKTCEVSDEAFRLSDTRVINENEKISHFGSADEQDQSIKFAVHKSLIEYGNSSLLVQREFSLKNHKIISKPRQDSFVDEETAMMQEAIHASLSLAERARIPPSGMTNSDGQPLTEEQEEALRKQEEEELKRVLELSMKDK